MDITKTTEWIDDCIKYRGFVLTGKFAHWCYDWDGLPIDETCGPEWDCCTCNWDKPRSGLT